MSLLRRASAPLLAIALGLPASGADLGKHKDFAQSPEFVYLASDDERKAWKDAKSEDDASKFIAFFWARRDPDLKTPANEFRDRFDALVAKADELFKLGSKRGSLTERGKAFILIGPPKAMSQSVKSSADQQTGATQGGFIDTGGGGTTITYQFTYEQAQLPTWSDVKSLDAKFQVDNGTKAEFVLDPGNLKRLEKKAAEKALVNPNLKELPVYKTREQVEAERKATVDAAVEAGRGAALSAPVREALEGILSKEPSGSVTILPIAYRDGATRLMIQLFVPSSAVPSPVGTRLAVLVKDKAGKDAARREEAAALQKSKGDWFADRSVAVAPGDYDVAVALLDASGPVLASAKRSVSVTTLPAEFGSSPLVLAYNDFPAESPKPDEPFVFSVRKFVSRGDGRYVKADGLSYAIRIYNPTPDPTTKKVSLKRTIRIKPKNGAPVEVPQPPEEPAVVPESKDGGALVLDAAGNLVEANMGEYFNPGDYTLQVKLTDGVSGKTIDISAPFTVVGPPPGAAAPKKK